MALFLERTDTPERPVERFEEVEAALAALTRPPHPWVRLRDEWGNLIRAEGQRQLALELRTVSSDGVAWWGLGTSAAPGLQQSLQMAERVVKVASTERLDLPTVTAAFLHFFEHQAAPEGMGARPLSGDHGRLYMAVVGVSEPRPAIGWTDVSRQLAGIPPGPVLAALSEPGRVFIGVFGADDKVTLTAREYRGPEAFERRLFALDAAHHPVQVPLPDGEDTRPADEVFTRADAWMVLESLYRFDAPPPGYAWRLTAG